MEMDGDVFSLLVKMCQSKTHVLLDPFIFQKVVALKKKEHLITVMLSFPKMWCQLPFLFFCGMKNCTCPAQTTRRIL